MTEPTPFMYIIRAGNRDTGTVLNSYFRLTGLPSTYKYFDCEIVGFYHNMILPVANSLVELKTDLPFINGYDLQNKRLTTIATNAINQNSTFQFRVENFNGRTVNFYLIDNDTANANTADDWVLYLKLKGVVE
jgi:hypothetical protein